MLTKIGRDALCGVHMDGGTLVRVSPFTCGAEDAVLSVIGKVGGSVDGQLDKVAA
jgi:hypothetical protein